MKYWWVNQNQNYEQEVSGGYMWSPKQKKNGAYNHFYDNMTKVEPGDIVFSFRNKKIPAIGIVLSKGYEASDPVDSRSAGSNLNRVGWKVDVSYQEIKNQIIPKDHIKDIKDTLPKKHYPLHPDTGKGLQSVYLACIPDAMAEILRALIGKEADEIIKLASNNCFSGEEDRIDEESEILIRILNNKDITETEKDSVVKSRRGQGVFKDRLFEVESECRVTKISNTNHLIATHIKPWAKCKNNQERLDGHNGLLLAPHVVHLFDKGYISFSDNGDLLISQDADLNSIKKMGIEVTKILNVGLFKDSQIIYLRYHRDFIFKK